MMNMKHAVPFALLLATIAWPTVAWAQDARRATSDVAPWLALDCGLGVAQPTVGNTNFGELAIGPSRTMPVTGATLGMHHPTGLLAYGTAHVFPFKLRSFGIVATIETVGLSPDGNTNVNVPISAIGGSDNAPTLTSVVAGPEAQARFGSFVVRGSALGGMRMTSYGDFTAYEWRLGFHGQGDWVFGGRPGYSGLSVGLFAGADVYPSLGWSTGMSVSFAFF
jgi:hypothetical protein